MKFELKPYNVLIEKSERYYRVYVKFETHKLHSEKLNLETAIRLRDSLLGFVEFDHK